MDGIELENQGRLFEREDFREDDQQSDVMKLSFPEAYKWCLGMSSLGRGAFRRPYVFETVWLAHDIPRWSPSPATILQKGVFEFNRPTLLFR